MNLTTNGEYVTDQKALELAILDRNTIFAANKTIQNPLI